MLIQQAIGTVVLAVSTSTSNETPITESIFLLDNTEFVGYNKDMRKNNKKQAQKVRPIKKLLQDVHTRHCCSVCGCKYGDEDCTVVSKMLVQERPCPKQCVCGGW